jgi:hypothetical protein
MRALFLIVLLLILAACETSGETSSAVYAARPKVCPTGYVLGKGNKCVVAPTPTPTPVPDPVPTPVPEPEPTPTPIPVVEWKLCAPEGQTCYVVGIAPVRYGTTTQYIEAMVGDKIECTNQRWGSDPAPNILKSCYTSGTVGVPPAPEPAPVPDPTPVEPTPSPSVPGTLAAGGYARFTKACTSPYVSGLVANPDDTYTPTFRSGALDQVVFVIAKGWGPQVPPSWAMGVQWAVDFDGSDGVGQWAYFPAECLTTYSPGERG